MERDLDLSYSSQESEFEQSQGLFIYWFICDFLYVINGAIRENRLIYYSYSYSRLKIKSDSHLYWLHETSASRVGTYLYW